MIMNAALKQNFMTSCDIIFAPFPRSQLDSYDLGEGKCLKINISEPKTRLFIGNIPKSKGKADIEDEFMKLSGKFELSTNQRSSS